MPNAADRANRRKHDEREAAREEARETEALRAELARRIDAYIRQQDDQQDARRRIELWRDQMREWRIWNGVRADEGLAPLPPPARHFELWEVAFAGFRAEDLDLEESPPPSP